ncbi:recombinase family protein [Carnobacterium maltaromaticum]|uniref:recombinase family protein n=1 Tax=Carnobacterium maltaromaticum TaxID=2751 RepID=UPI0039BDD4DB
MEINKLKAALYVRVSTTEQANEGYSIQAQTERLKNYAKAKDYFIIKTYTDPGFSGAKLDRPALQEMITDIENNQIDIVLVYKLDRLSRSQKNTLFLIEDVFLKNNVDFVSMQESFDTTSAFGRAMIGILSVFAQLERDTITERMGMGRTERAKEGYFHGGGTTKIPVGYDYVDGLLQINDYEAEIVRSIFELYNSGKGVNAVSTAIKNKFPSKRKFNVSLIRGILTNNIYIGLIKFKDGVYQGKHEPIVSKDIFDKAQSEINRRTTDKIKVFNSKYLLTGLTYCGHCGARMKATGSSTLKDGTRLTYYNCYSKSGSPAHMVKDLNCPSKTYRTEVLDEYLISQMKRISKSDISIEFDDNTNNDSETDKSVVKKEIGSIESRIEKLLKLYEFGNVPLDVLNSKINSLNNEKAKLKEILNENKIEKIDDKADKLEIFNNLKNIDWDTMTHEDIKVIISRSVEKITVFNEKIEIEWKF